MDETHSVYPGSGMAPGYSALYDKKIPLDGAVIIRAMLGWVSSCPAAATEAAPIYVMKSADQPLRLINGDADPSLYKASRRRLILAEKHHHEHDEPQQQHMLSPRHLYRLGHLLTCFKYHTPGTFIEPSADNKHHQLHFLPHEFITGRLGLRLSGSAYSLLENDLATLATTVVHLQERSAAGTWKTIHSYPLIQRFDTGRVRSHSGRLNRQLSLRRKQYWNIELGQPLVAMLNTAYQELSVTMPSAWQAAGKNRTAQWLAFFAETHGYDGRTVFDHNIGTLLQRTRLSQRQAGELVGKLTRRTQRMPATPKPYTQDLFAPSIPPSNPTNSNTLLDSVKEHGAKVRSGIRRISAAIERLSHGGLYRRCEVVSAGHTHSQQTHSRQHMTTALFNKFRLSHWPAPLQQALQSLSSHTRKRVATTVSIMPNTWLLDHYSSIATLISSSRSASVYQLVQTVRRHFQLLTIQSMTSYRIASG